MSFPPAELNASPAAPVESVPADAPPKPAGPTLLEIAAERHGLLQAMLTGDKASLSPDDVHDLRVATRRLTEIVGLFEPLMDTAMADAAGGTLRDLRKSAGDLRDLDVLEEHLTGRRLPAPLRHVCDTIRAELPARRQALEVGVIAARGAASISGAMVYLARLFESCSAPDAREAALRKLAVTLNKRIKRRRKQLRAAFGKAATKQTPVALHAARIAAKKLRYVLELGHESHLSRAGEELGQLKKIQKLLGEHHDVHVILETLESRLPAHGSVKNLRPAWTKYKRQATREQAQRAAEFFVKSYLFNSR